MTGFQFDMLHKAQGGSISEGDIVAGMSWGNDGIALAQWFIERGLADRVICLFNDTGWALPAIGNAEGWLDRVTRCEIWAQANGMRVARTSSMGFRELVLWRRGFPRQGIQFCTEHLKIIPTIKWLAENDPHHLAICANGKRAAESLQRANTVEWVRGSPSHDFRDLWQPIWDIDEEGRDALIHRAGFEVLPHKSKECQLCVNENREGLLMTPAEVIADVAALEAEASAQGTGRSKTFFRPAKKMGATGIHEVIRWAQAKHGKYRTLSDDTGKSETESGCDGGFCAS